VGSTSALADELLVDARVAQHELRRAGIENMQHVHQQAERQAELLADPGEFILHEELCTG